MRLSCRLGTRAFSGACQDRSVGLQIAFQGKKCSLTLRIFVCRWEPRSSVLRWDAAALPGAAPPGSAEHREHRCELQRISRILMLSLDSAACSDVSRQTWELQK